MLRGLFDYYHLYKNNSQVTDGYYNLQNKLKKFTYPYALCKARVKVSSLLALFSDILLGLSDQLFLLWDCKTEFLMASGSNFVFRLKDSTNISQS